MTIFSKPKDHRVPAPKACHVCGERVGSVRLHFIAPTKAHLTAAERESWICDECLNAVKRGSATN